MNNWAGDRAPGLGGTGLVADDLYLLAHNDLTGRPLLPPRARGLGLAGGLLAELMLCGCAGLRADGRIAVREGLRHSEVPRDALARRVLEQIYREDLLPVPEWLQFLALTAADDVAARLEQAGYLARVARRLPWRPARPAPVNAEWALTPLVRATRSSTVYEAVLSGLAVACGLRFRMEQFTGAAPVTGDVLARLGPGVRELVAQTQIAADATVLTRR